MDKPLISVILPIYNVEQYLEKCLSSLQQQTYVNFEALLVDDGSTDNSGAVCQRYSAKDSRFIYLYKANGGVSDARNYGLNKASGEYISFVDPDDYVTHDYLSYLMELLIANSGCISACNHWICRGKRQKTNAQSDHSAEYFGLKEAYERISYHDTIDVSLWGKLYSRDIFESIRFPKGKIFEDTAVFAQILATGGGIVYGYKPQYYYQIRDKSITTLEFDEKKLHYIGATDAMCNVILQQFPELGEACLRRRVHARMSTLRFMKVCEERFQEDKERIISFIKCNGKKVLKNKKTPTVDKIAIASLFLGESFFYWAWSIFCKLTGRAV